MKLLNERDLIIIGNGFDLFHGVNSSYYSFKKYVDKHNKILSFDFDICFECDDIWGDFENNLALLSREMLMESVDNMLDINMSTFDEQDDDFSAAEYFMSIEMGTQPVQDLTEELPRCFRKWIKTLSATGEQQESCTKLLKNDSLYINFNYTEFLETLYQIPKKQILYIHGNRNDKKEELILGHGQDPEHNFDEWHDRNKGNKRFRDFKTNKKGKRYRNNNLTYSTYFLDDPAKGNWRTPIRYYAAGNASGIIEGYFEESAKKTGNVISDNSDFFFKLRSVEQITVLGHSLSPVDYPYFRKIIDVNENPDKIYWRISWYSEEDKTRIETFAQEAHIEMSNIELIQL